MDNVKLKGSLGQSDNEMVVSKFLKEKEGLTVNSPPWTSEKQTLASSGVSLVEYCEMKPWKEERLKKAS